MPENNETKTEKQEAVFAAPKSQAELDQIVESRLARERAKFADYDDLKAKAAKADQADDAAKSELQKAIERAEKAEKASQDATLSGLRAQVALEKGLTPTQAKRLVGANRDELLADADELLADLKGPEPGKAPPAGGAGEDVNSKQDMSAEALVKAATGK